MMNFGLYIIEIIINSNPYERSDNLNVKPNYYAIIPAYVRYSQALSPNEKLLYGEITALSNKEGYCWACNGYFAELYGVSKRSVTRWLDKLKTEGFIAIEYEYVGDTMQLDKRKLIVDKLACEQKA